MHEYKHEDCDRYTAVRLMSKSLSGLSEPSAPFTTSGSQSHI